jgi:Ni2+-binding GTPase involved in maturation of urease and hydrogenase
MQILLPNRFEGLTRNKANLEAIIVPIENSLEVIDRAASEIKSCGSGLFLILRGKSGAGKTTFLRTVPLFRQSVAVAAIQKSDDILTYLQSTVTCKERLRIITVEGREALGEAQDAELENAIHGINQFIRSDNGSSTLVVWPCNTDVT